MIRSNAFSFIQSASYWTISEGHMHKTTLQIVKALCNFQDVVIGWPNKNAKKRENIENDT